MNAQAPRRMVTDAEWRFLNTLKVIGRRVAYGVAHLPAGAIMAEADREIEDIAFLLCRDNQAGAAVIRRALLMYVRGYLFH